MTPKQQAIDLYNGDKGEYQTDRLRIMQLLRGQIIETPDCCLWGFPIRLTPRLLKHGTVRIHHEPDPDCWMVWLCTGNLDSVLHLIPYPLPYIAFARDNRLRAYSFEKLTRKLMKTPPPAWHNQPEQQHQFRGGGSSGPTKQQKETERLNQELIKKQLAAMEKEAPEAPMFIPPEQPKYAPPPTQTSQDAEAAAQEFRKSAKMRRGFARSKLGAGDTGKSSTPAPSATAQGAKPTLG